MGINLRAMREVSHDVAIIVSKFFILFNKEFTVIEDFQHLLSDNF